MKSVALRPEALRDLCQKGVARVLIVAITYAKVVKNEH